MFITLKEVVGEKTVTLDGSIPPGKKIAIVEIMNNSMLCYCRKTLYHFDGKEVMGKKHVMLTEGHHMSKKIRDLDLAKKGGPMQQRAFWFSLLFSSVKSSQDTPHITFMSGFIHVLPFARTSKPTFTTVLFMSGRLTRRRVIWYLGSRLLSRSLIPDKNFEVPSIAPM